MIQLQDVSIRQDDFLLQHLNLHIRAGEYAVLMGPTGCGKTTVMETICGLRSANGGKISVGGKDVT